MIRAFTLAALLGALLGMCRGHASAESYESWRARTPVTYVTPQETMGALMRAGMPLVDAARLTLAAATCEAPVYDRDGRTLGASLVFVGDHGRAFGPFQIRYDVWGWLWDVYDMNRIEGHAAAAMVIYEEYGRTLKAWSCA